MVQLNYIKINAFMNDSVLFCVFYFSSLLVFLGSLGSEFLVADIFRTSKSMHCSENGSFSA